MPTTDTTEPQTRLRADGRQRPGDELAALVRTLAELAAAVSRERARIQHLGSVADPRIAVACLELRQLERHTRRLVAEAAGVSQALPRERLL